MEGWDGVLDSNSYAMVVEGRPVLVYCALDGRLGKGRRTVAWAAAKNSSDPQLLEWEKLERQPWVNASLHSPEVYCDPLTYRSAGDSGQQMVGAIVRDHQSQAILSWRVDSLEAAPVASGVVYNLKVECLCPDLAFFVGCCATPHPALLPATSLLPLAAGRGAGCGRPSASPSAASRPAPTKGGASLAATCTVSATSSATRSCRPSRCRPRRMRSRCSTTARPRAQLSSCGTWRRIER